MKRNEYLLFTETNKNGKEVILTGVEALRLDLLSDDSIMEDVVEDSVLEELKKLENGEGYDMANDPNAGEEILSEQRDICQEILNDLYDDPSLCDKKQLCFLINAVDNWPECEQAVNALILVAIDDIDDNYEARKDMDFENKVDEAFEIAGVERL
jgi:hypothetical protein